MNAFDLERVLNTFSDEDLDIYLYVKEKRLKQKQIALLICKSESYITRRIKFIEDEIERDILDNGEYTKPDEKFVKAVQKATAAKKMTVAEYRDKILFQHGKERIKVRFQKFLTPAL